MFSKISDSFPRRVRRRFLRVMEVSKDTREALNQKRIQEEARKRMCNSNGMGA